MGLKEKVKRLEAAVGDAAWDLTLLTNAELLELERVQTQVEATGENAAPLITPELEAALERVRCRASAVRVVEKAPLAGLPSL
jgi:hypothetical protein